MANGLSYFIAVLRREATLIFKNKVTLFISFVAPLIGISMLWWIFSAGVIRDLPIAVVNHDQSPLGEKLVRMIETSPTINIVDEAPDLATAKQLMDKGIISAFIYIPQGLEEDIITGQSPCIPTYINNLNVVAGGLIKSSLQKTLSTFSAGVKLQVEMKKGYTEQQAMARALPIRFDTHVLFNPYVNYAYFLALGLIPLMVVVITFLGTIYAFGYEIKEGTSKQLLATANNNVFIAVIAKILPHTFIYLMHMMVVALVLIHKIGVPMHGNIWAILISQTMLILAYQSIALIFLAITSNMRLSLSLGSAYTMMALTFSGLTFPAFAMPKLTVWFSYLFPYTFWLELFMNTTLRSMPGINYAPYYLALLIFMLLSVFTFGKLKHVFSEEKYWGKS